MGDGDKKIHGGGELTLFWNPDISKKDAALGGLDLMGRVSLPVKGPFGIDLGLGVRVNFAQFLLSDGTTQILDGPGIEALKTQGFTFPGSTKNTTGGPVTYGGSSYTQPVAGTAKVGLMFEVGKGWRLGLVWQPSFGEVTVTPERDTAMAQFKANNCINPPGQKTCPPSSGKKPPEVEGSRQRGSEDRPSFTTRQGGVLGIPMGDNAMLEFFLGHEHQVVSGEDGSNRFVAAASVYGHTDRTKAKPIQVTIEKVRATAPMEGSGGDIRFRVSSSAESSGSVTVNAVVAGHGDISITPVTLTPGEDGTISVPIEGLGYGIYEVTFIADPKDSELVVELNGAKRTRTEPPLQFAIQKLELDIKGPSSIDKTKGEQEATYNVTANSIGAGTWKVVDSEGKDVDLGVKDEDKTFAIADISNPAKIKVPTDKLEWGKNYQLVVTWTATGKQEVKDILIGAQPTGASISDQIDPGEINAKGKVVRLGDTFPVTFKPDKTGDFVFEIGGYRVVREASQSNTKNRVTSPANFTKGMTDAIKVPTPTKPRERVTMAKLYRLQEEVLSVEGTRGWKVGDHYRFVIKRQGTNEVIMDRVFVCIKREGRVGGTIVDTDKDGVDDRREATGCVGQGAKGKVNTTGAQVGCPKPDDGTTPPDPVDSDGDGVPNDKDKCPDDPAGRSPDPARKGCPKR